MNDTFNVVCRWTSQHTIEVPDDMTREEAMDVFQNGEFDDRLGDQFNSANAELTDWEVQR